MIHQNIYDSKNTQVLAKKKSFAIISMNDREVKKE